MNMRKLLQTSATTVALMTLLANPVLADETKTTEKEKCTTDQYGHTTCTTEKVTEEIVTTREEQTVTHETVEAGIEDFRYLGFAGMLAGIGATFFILSKITQKVYVLDN